MRDGHKQELRHLNLEHWILKVLKLKAFLEYRGGYGIVAWGFMVD
jgi:hypothetical protein